MRGLLALDIDGVLTDGTVTINAAGEEQKRLSYRDIDAVFRARREGLVLAILTAEDTPLARRIAERLEADRVVTGCRDKSSALVELAGDLNVELAAVCFIGDSEKDIAALEAAGLGLVPSDAVEAARKVADIVLRNPGGRGAVAEGVDRFMAYLADQEGQRAKGEPAPGSTR